MVIGGLSRARNTHRLSKVVVKIGIRNETYLVNIACEKQFLV